MSSVRMGGRERVLTFQQTERRPATQGLVGPLYRTARCRSAMLLLCAWVACHRSLKEVSHGYHSLLFMSLTESLQEISLRQLERLSTDDDGRSRVTQLGTAPYNDKG